MRHELGSEGVAREKERKIKHGDNECGRKMHFAAFLYTNMLDDDDSGRTRPQKLRRKHDILLGSIDRLLGIGGGSARCCSASFSSLFVPLRQH